MYVYVDDVHLHVHVYQYMYMLHVQYTCMYIGLQCPRAHMMHYMYMYMYNIMYIVATIVHICNCEICRRICSVVKVYTFVHVQYLLMLMCSLLEYACTITENNSVILLGLWSREQND